MDKQEFEETYFEEIVEVYLQDVKKLLLEDCISPTELDEQDQYTLWNQAVEKTIQKNEPIKIER